MTCYRRTARQNNAIALAVACLAQFEREHAQAIIPPCRDDSRATQRMMEYGCHVLRNGSSSSPAEQPTVPHLYIQWTTNST